MKKILLVPDSFKGTLSSREICGIMAEQVHRVWPEAQVRAIPVADGGEGSVDTFLSALGGERRTVFCQGPFGEEMEGFYGLLPDGKTAVVEMAAAAGLPLVGGKGDPERTTTYGVGQLMAAAVRDGARRIVLGLGGSATNDGGCGAAAALGVRFYRRGGETYVPTGGTLAELERIDASGLDLGGAELICMCDIDNPLCGPQGAAAVFGPQKGADEAMVERLDQGLRHLAKIVKRDLGREILDLPGAGAAGGMGGGCQGLLGGRLQMGIETVLDLVDFDRALQGADLVLTGEGKLDRQSLRGKVVIGVARRAKPAGVPVVAVVGDIGEGVEEAYTMGLAGIFSTNRRAVSFAEARQTSRRDMANTVWNLLTFLKTMGH